MMLFAGSRSKPGEGGLRVRKATLPDSQQVSALFYRNNQCLCRNEPYVFREPKDTGRIETYIRKLIEQKTGLFLVMESGVRIVGYAFGYEERRGSVPFQNNRISFYLDGIGLDEAFCRRKYIQILLESVIGHCREKSYDDIVLNVERFNMRAFRAYRKNGFTVLSYDMILKL